MTSSGGILAYGPTRDATKLLIAAGTGQSSTGAEWSAVVIAVMRRRARRVLARSPHPEQPMTAARVTAAMRMGVREQRRRPLLLILLVLFPAYVISRSIAETQATPHTIGLPGGTQILTSMKELHGAVMAGTAIAFAAGLCGVFIMKSALAGDRRLVLAGYRAGETVLARLSVLTADTALVVTVSLAVTAVYFTPASWVPFAVAAVLLGLISGTLGALLGALLDKLTATYLMLFLVMTDLGIVQNPMFGDGTPADWAVLLPGYGPVRLMIDSAYSTSFHAGGALLLGLGWTAALTTVVYRLLARAVGAKTRETTRPQR
jgi:hypothetical protein